LAAYDDYLRALQLYRARGSGLRDAERSLLAAVAADPGYAKAYALLASVLLVQHYYVAVNVSDAQRRGRSAAERAVALDDSLAAAHTALGHAHVESFEWSDAERELRRGIALDPRSAEAHYRLAELLINVGRVREALTSLEEVNRLDPLYVTSVGDRAWVMSMLGRNDEAEAEIRRALSLDPRNLVSNYKALQILAYAGRRDELVALARALLRQTAEPPVMGRVAWGLARAGALDEAARLAGKIEALPPGTVGRALGLVHARMGLGDVSGALDALEVVAETQPQWLVGDALVSERYDTFRADPRFAAILRRFNLDVERLTLPDGGRSR
jgi:tetratricopeptide (TPR) repeat protein